MKKGKIIGLVLILIGVIIIITAAILNSIHFSSKLADTVYVYDVLSSIAVIIVSAGVVVILKNG